MLAYISTIIVFAEVSIEDRFNYFSYNCALFDIVILFPWWLHAIAVHFSWLAKTRTQCSGRHLWVLTGLIFTIISFLWPGTYKNHVVISRDDFLKTDEAYINLASRETVKLDLQLLANGLSCQCCLLVTCHFYCLNGFFYKKNSLMSIYWFEKVKPLTYSYILVQWFSWREIRKDTRFRQILEKVWQARISNSPIVCARPMPMHRVHMC